MSDEDIELAQIETIEELKDKLLDLIKQIKELRNDVEQLAVTFNTHLHGSRFPMTPPKQKVITGKVVLKKEEGLPAKDEFMELCEDYKALKNDFVKLLGNFDILHKFAMNLGDTMEGVKAKLSLLDDDLLNMKKQIANMQQQLNDLAKMKEIREERIKKLLDVVQEKLEGRE
ncbi:MAG: hypothetical protein ACP5PT_06825 [Brevinematia bacterium]